jgi:hypothetical protein
MAFVMCSCNNSNSPTIKKEVISSYYGELLCEDILPTELKYYYIYEYDSKERLILTQCYDENDFLYHEEKTTYVADKLKTIEMWTQFSEDKEKNETIWFKDNDIWCGKTNGELIILNESKHESDSIMLNYLVNYQSQREEYLPLKEDGTFAIVMEDYQCVGKVVETDKFGNWIKAVGKEKFNYTYIDDKENYVVFTREITYF